MPAGTALFGSSGRSQNKNLLEFKAGKMTMKGKTVYPDKRKGLVYIHQSEDSLMHFCWKDRTSGTVEDDLIIFPDDVEFKHVSQCTTGRVYLLKFKSSSRKFFFWVQEPKTDKDEENCRKVNEILNNPPTLGSQRSGGATPDCDLQNLLSNMSQQQLMQLFGGVGQISGLSNLLSHINRPSSSSSSGGTNNGGSSGGGGNSSSTTSTPATPVTTTTSVTAPTTATAGGATTVTPAAGSTTPSSTVTPTNAAPPNTTPLAPRPKVNSALLESYLSRMQNSNVASPSDGAQPSSTPRPKGSKVSSALLESYLSRIQNSNVPGDGAHQPLTNQPKVDLSSSITTESLGAILNDPNLVEELERHLPSVGDGRQQDQLRGTLASPQFQQAVSMFSSALQSGQLGPVVSQFEVGEEAVNAAAQGNMEEFVRALQAANLSEEDKKKTPPPQEGKKDDDDNMSLD